MATNQGSVNRNGSSAGQIGAASAASPRLAALLLTLSAGLLAASGAMAQTKMTPPVTGHSNSIVGIPAPSMNGAQGEPNAAKSTPPPAPAANFYGTSPPGTFSNTSAITGPPPTTPQGVPSTPSGIAGPVQNPNTVVSSAQGPVSNGTAQPLVNDRSIPVPVLDTGQAENPQESSTAIVWIIILTAGIIGSIYGLIKWTQPGGVA